MDMKRYKCSICAHVYDPMEGDPSQGIQPGVAFEDLPDSWHCPVCLAEKGKFAPELEDPLMERLFGTRS
jgi:rubredoxin